MLQSVANLSEELTPLSHSGHAIDLHVAHRIVAVSADDFLADCRRFRRQTFDTTVKSGASATSTGAAGDQTQGATDDRYARCPHSEVK